MDAGSLDLFVFNPRYSNGEVMWSNKEQTGRKWVRKEVTVNFSKGEQVNIPVLYAYAFFKAQLLNPGVYCSAILKLNSVKMCIF